jgi:hypothetical protein
METMTANAQHHATTTTAKIATSPLVLRAPKTSEHIYFRPNFPEHLKEEFLHDVAVLPEFVSQTESDELMLEVERAVKRRRYQAGHFDQVISGYKEIQRSEWVRFHVLSLFSLYLPQPWALVGA